jgi:hypothetical protein
LNANVDEALSRNTKFSLGDARKPPLYRKRVVQQTQFFSLEKPQTKHNNNNNKTYDNLKIRYFIETDGNTADIALPNDAVRRYTTPAFLIFCFMFTIQIFRHIERKSVPVCFSIYPS